MEILRAAPQLRSPEATLGKGVVGATGGPAVILGAGFVAAGAAAAKAWCDAADAANARRLAEAPPAFCSHRGRGRVT